MAVPKQSSRDSRACGGGQGFFTQTAPAARSHTHAARAEHSYGERRTRHPQGRRPPYRSNSARASPNRSRPFLSTSGWAQYPKRAPQGSSKRLPGTSKTPRSSSRRKQNASSSSGISSRMNDVDTPLGATQLTRGWESIHDWRSRDCRTRSHGCGRGSCRDGAARKSRAHR